MSQEQAAALIKVLTEIKSIVFVGMICVAAMAGSSIVRNAFERWR